MSAFYDQASLVVVPSGYKSGKIYAQKPLTTDGQLSFTRSTGATRVGPDGLIEKVRTNIVLQSNTFDAVNWFPANAVITANAGTSPSGANDAWKIETNTIGTETRVRQTVTTTVGVEYSFSCYMKAGNVNWGIVRNYSISAGGRAWFDLQNGVVGAADSGITPSIESVGNGWYRCSIIGTTTTSGAFDIAPAPANSDFTSDAIGDYVLIYGAQGETGVTTDYIPTTTAAVSVGPVANVPRLDYAPTLGQSGVSCPRLILEGQRTNYQLYSENSAQWAQPADGLTVAYNTSETLDPSGYYGAEKVTSVSGSRRMFDAVSNPAGAFTVSVFVKAGTGYIFRFLTTSGSINVDFNLSTGAITNNAGTGSIVDYGNGWYRCIATATSAGSETIQYRFPIAFGEYMYFWGAQAEAGSYATSYCPTLGAAVTRGADACSKTGVTSLIGQTEGTIFYDFVFKTGATTTDGQFGISTAAGNDRVIVWNNFTLSTLGFQIRANSTNVINNVSLGTFVDGTTYKMAVAYKSGSTAVYVNGTQVYTSSTTFTFAASLTDFIVGAYATIGFNAHQKVNQALLFKTRLTNAQLAELTTL